MFRSNLSSDIINDSDKASAAMDALVSQVESKLAGLSPEDALVHLDSLSFEVETPANGGLAAEYDVLQQIGNSRLSTRGQDHGHGAWLPGWEQQHRLRRDHAVHEGRDRRRGRTSWTSSTAGSSPWPCVSWASTW